MKLLFDENLAPSLVLVLADIFPQSEHVARIGLGAAPDREVWEYAREHHYTLVSKDSEFPRVESAVRFTAEGRLDSPWQLHHQADRIYPAQQVGRHPVVV